MNELDLNQKNAQNPNNAQPQGAPQAQEEKIAINGFQQVFEMLRIADPAFRESLLRRLAARDRVLAAALHRELANEGLI